MEPLAIISGDGSQTALLLAFRMLATALLIMAAGAVLARFEGGSHHTTLARLNGQVFIPCLVFAAMNRTPFQATDAAVMGLAAVIYIVCCYPLAHIWASRSGDGDRSGLVSLLFSSTSTLLLPLSWLFFGSQGLCKAAAFHLTNLFILYTWGVRLAGQPSRFREFLKKPTLHAALLAVLLQQTASEPPQQVRELLWLVEKGIGMMAAGAVPILLMSHGYALYGLNAGGARRWSGFALARMLTLMATAGLLLVLFRSSGIVSMERGYDLLAYLDMRTSEAVLLLAAALPCTLSTIWHSGGAAVSRRNGSLILASALLSVVALAGALVVINRCIFSF